MDNVKYMYLTDTVNRGLIYRREGRQFYLFRNGEWIRAGISIGYFDPEAPEFECYKIISEKEAFEILNIK